MKKPILILVLLLAVLFVNQANASSYSVNEQAIDQLFTKATETSMISVSAAEISPVATNVSSPVMASAKKDAVVAIVLDFFLGGLGIHRFYLGTKTLTGLGYILTCGGIFGIVPLIDFVVLIINYQNIGAFVDNPKFFMWN